MRRALVTGAGGFVGRHLVRRLRVDRWDVTALERAHTELTDRAALTAAVAAARPEAVFHLAAARARSGAQQRADTATVNALSGLWLVDALPASCRVVVRLGSSTEYAASAGPMDEQTPLAPRGFFGATKAAGSLLVVAAAAERGLRSAVLRAFQVYGPEDHPGRLVPAALRAARDGSVLPLTAPGSRRDWTWVGDVVEACVLAAGHDGLPTGSVLNLGTGRQTANEALVELVGEVSGRPVRVEVGAHGGRAWDTADWVCDPTAAREHLGWVPAVGLREGLTRCWESVVDSGRRS